jgi:hemin uptake protein HemP
MAIADKERATGSDPDLVSGTRSIAVSNQRIDSRDIFVATCEILIAHGDETYRLRLTAQNKLILTK